MPRLDIFLAILFFAALLALGSAIAAVWIFCFGSGN
jgi:hypothetical protein